MIDIDDILKIAIDKEASDVHLVRKLKPIIRVNRELIRLEERDALTYEDIYEIYEHFVNNSELDETFKKDKRLDINYEVYDMRLRVNVSMSNGYPIFTIRIIKKELPVFKNLNIPDIIRKIALSPQGMLLVTGKSNTGKSTTLNALVNEINHTTNKKILMLENPIEYMHVPDKSLIVQKEIGKGRDCPTFGIGATNALREDCDILVLGEIRDRETMDAAIEMVESGHLVIGTMHTRSCAETIDRIISFYDPSEQTTIKYMISSVLRAVISQRLLNGIKDELVMIPEIMIVDEVVSYFLRKEKFNKNDLEDAIQTRLSKGSLSLTNALAYAVIKEKITMETAMLQIDDDDKERLLRTIRQFDGKELNYFN